MLNYKNSTLIFVFILVIMASVGLVHDIPLTYFLIPVMLYLSVLFYGSYFIQSGFFMKVVCNGDRNIHEVAITFDDGPAETSTPVILDILAKNEVPAAFFCIGEKVAENPELIQRISGEGHLIGNHSYSHHFFFDFLSQENMIREIRATNRAVEKLIQKRIHFFRPPYGVTTPVLAKAVKAAKVTPVGWSLRSMDTVTKDADQLIKKINKQLQPGDIILLHDTSAATVQALQEIIDTIRNKGFKIVRIDQLLKLTGYA